VFNGDLKHEFGRISEEEWRHIRRLLSVLERRCHVVVIAGNHDVMLPTMAQSLGIELRDHLALGSTLILHGHQAPDATVLKGVSHLIIAHEHPRIQLFDGIRSETYDCFLWGSWKRKKLLVLPAFSSLHGGGDILTQAPLGPFLDKMDAFEVIAAEEGRLVNLGRLGKIRKNMPLHP
jgi:uncharacterized protein